MGDVGCLYLERRLRIDRGRRWQLRWNRRHLRRDRDPGSHLKLVGFSRNFGHPAAISAGRQHSVGDIVAVIDADLQNPPEELIRFIEKIREGFDLVYAIRTKRKEGPSSAPAIFCIIAS